MLSLMLLALWPVGLAVIIGALAEWQWPWRRGIVDRLRWLHAANLFLISIILVAVLIPVSKIGVAILADDRGWGLLNILPIPGWAAVVLGILILDLTAWTCHWALHRSPLLWRVHRLHHSDAFIDVSTAFRFHPAETVLRFVVELIVIFVLGVPAEAIIISYGLILGFNVWEHTNMTTPRALQHLSGIIVTPDYHRIHHSTNEAYQNNNLGTIFILWDKIFGTCLADRNVDETIRFGLGPGNRLAFQTLSDLLIDPFRKE